jgi:hypothetical protein
LFSSGEEWRQCAGCAPSPCWGRAALPQKLKNNPMHSRNTTAERHIVRSVKLLLRRANQRQTGDGRRFRNAARNSRRGVSSAQFEANTKFVFYESRLTRRAKQWHYAIMAHSKVAPASRQTRRKESRLSRNAMDERSSFHAGQILRQKISNHPAS